MPRRKISKREVYCDWLNEVLDEIESEWWRVEDEDGEYDLDIELLLSDLERGCLESEEYDEYEYEEYEYDEYDEW